MRKLMITIFIFIAIVCSCACVNSTDCNTEVDFSDTIETIPPDTPVETVEPIPEPEPKYFTTYRPDIQLGVHDYYNSIVHGDKASIKNVKVVVQYDFYSIELNFDDLESVAIPLTDLDCSYPVVVQISIETDNQYATTYPNNITLQLDSYVNEEELIVECGIENITVDFIYDTTDIKYPLTEVERHLLSTLLAHEYGYKNADEGQKAVISVVFNRLDYFGGTLHDIIYAKNQFTPAKLIDPETGLSEYKDIFGYYTHCIDTVDYVSAYGVTIPRSVLYFRTNYYFNWNTVTAYTNIGNTYFSGSTKLIDRYGEWHHYT